MPRESTMCRNNKRRKTWKRLFKTNLLVILTLFGTVVGFCIGFSVRSAWISEDGKIWLGMAGELYLRMIQMMIVPLIVTSVITGVASMDPKSNGKIGAVAFVYVLVTNCLGCVVGAILCFIIEPGKGLSKTVDMGTSKETLIQTKDIFADLLRNLLPDNIVSASFQQTLTMYKTKDSIHHVIVNGTNVTSTVKEIIGKYKGSAPSTNILGLIVVSCLFGLATSALKDKERLFYSFFSSVNEIILQIMRWSIWTTPVGVASLIAQTIATTENIHEDFRKLGMFVLSVMIGLFIFALVLVPLVYFAVKRSNPFRFLSTLIEPILITLATASTAIAIPESLVCLETKNGIDKRITRFVVPFTTTLGCCGSSLYISTSCIFIMQLVDLDIDASKIFLIILLTTVSSLAIPAVANAGLVTVIVLLTTLNIPAEATSLLFALEWFLDRSRSVTNYCIHCLCPVIAYKIFESSLPVELELREPLIIANTNTKLMDSEFLHDKESNDKRLISENHITTV